MPASLSLKANPFRAAVCPKSARLTAVALLFPLLFFGQSLTGLWTGALRNDSATVRKDQLFEIALTEYKGKVYGYSRSEFIVDDTLYYIMKRVKGTIEGDVCQVEDEEIISYNFKGKLDKGVKVTSTFRRNSKDSTWYLDGSWKTNATKKYYSVGGKLSLAEERDLTASRIFPHLEELNLAGSVAFYKERVEGPALVKIARPEKVKTEYSSKAELLAATTVPAPVTAQPGFQRAESKPADPIETLSTSVSTPADISNTPEAIAYTAGVRKQDTELPRTDIKEIPVTRVTVTPAEANKTVALNPVPDMTAVVVPIQRPQSELPKTEAPVIPTTSVAVKPAEENKTRAEVNTRDFHTEIVALNPPSRDLKGTDVNPIPSTKVMAAPTATTKSRAESKTIDRKTDQPVAVTENNAIAAATPVRTNNNSRTTNINASSGSVQNTDRPATVSNKPPAASNNKPVQTAPVVKTQPVTTIPNNTNTATVKRTDAVTVNANQPVTNTAVKPTDPGPASVNPATVSAPVPRKPLEEIKAAGAMIGGRKTEFSQIVNFKSDSIEVALYDNGEIDGDTVSIYLNGQVEMSRQGLKASAIKKTIHITPGNEDFTLVLFAENLGKYPPNTGLLVVHDGDEVYNLRFSSDFQKNAGIIFRRSK